MKRNFSLGLAVFVLMALMTVTVNAQDADNPWYLVAFVNDVEVAFYNIEMITGMEATVQNVTIALENGEIFYHPVATTTFGFDPRKDGTDTSNEAITTLGWSISYTNNRLHFSKPVSGINVYNMLGTSGGSAEPKVAEYLTIISNLFSNNILSALRRRTLN